MQAVSGHLLVSPRSDGSQTSLRAQLLDERSKQVALLPELHSAVVERVTANGIKITGHEVVARRSTNKASADHYQQTWWCLVHTMFIADALDLVQLDELFQPIVPDSRRATS